MEGWSASLDEIIDLSRKAELLIECHSKQFNSVVAGYLLSLLSSVDFAVIFFCVEKKMKFVLEALSNILFVSHQSTA